MAAEQRFVTLEFEKFFGEGKLGMTLYEIQAHAQDENTGIDIELGNDLAGGIYLHDNKEKIVWRVNARSLINAYLDAKQAEYAAASVSAADDGVHPTAAPQ